MSAIGAAGQDQAEIRLPRRRDLSIDYLRTTLTIMVIAYHSSLAYTTLAHGEKEHVFRATLPIVDEAQSAFFDYTQNFNDAFFMSLMFFVSGLFVYPALRRHGTLRFIGHRTLRLGVPFAFTVIFLMPVAYYASWQLTSRNQGFGDFYRHLARGGFVPGPPWFIWVLLLFDVVLALLLRPLRRWGPRAGHFMRKLKDHAVASFLVMLAVAATAYLPLLVRYGFWTWANVGRSPFSFQIARIGLYAVWFVFGFLVGAPGFANGLIARSGSLARRWPWWVAGCLLAYNALWFVPRIAVVAALPHASRGGLGALLWLTSCVASSFAFLAFFRGVEMEPRWWWLSLSRAAYVMFLVHYVYVLWAQRAIVGIPIHPGFKFVFVFVTATMLSWMTAQLVLRIPKLNSIL